MCWICGFPMLPPNPERSTGVNAPGRWECNIDHIGVKNGRPRETRGSHQHCNCARGHDDPATMQSHIKSVRRAFQRGGFVNGMFTDEINQRIADLLFHGLIARGSPAAGSSPLSLDNGIPCVAMGRGSPAPDRCKR
jgi:hypothetical protein